MPGMDRSSPATPARSPIELAETRLRWLDRRQEVLARNISNADTPGYRARDVTPFAQILARTSFGRYVYAIGNNEEAARFSERWRAVIRHDPFYHPALSLTTFGEDLE